MTREDALALIRSRLAGMVPPIEGGCLCGAFRYTSTVTPFFASNCHCRACQRLSGAPYVSAFNVAAEGFVHNGAPTIAFKRPSDAGHEVTTHSCAACGARLFAQSAGGTAFVAIFASTLDDASGFVPVANVYLSDAAPWAVAKDCDFAFQRMPPAPKV